MIRNEITLAGIGPEALPATTDSNSIETKSKRRFFMIIIRGLKLVKNPIAY